MVPVLPEGWCRGLTTSPSPHSQREAGHDSDPGLQNSGFLLPTLHREDGAVLGEALLPGLSPRRSARQAASPRRRWAFAQLTCCCRQRRRVAGSRGPEQVRAAGSELRPPEASWGPWAELHARRLRRSVRTAFAQRRHRCGTGMRAAWAAGGGAVPGTWPGAIPATGPPLPTATVELPADLHTLCLSPPSPEGSLI